MTSSRYLLIVTFEVIPYPCNENLWQIHKTPSLDTQEPFSWIFHRQADMDTQCNTRRGHVLSFRNASLHYNSLQSLIYWLLRQHPNEISLLMHWHVSVALYTSLQTHLFISSPEMSLVSKERVPSLLGSMHDPIFKTQHSIEPVGAPPFDWVIIISSRISRAFVV